MTAQPISFEVKSQLAKLLAVENIYMRHDPSAKTAYFDIKKRLLVLPVWQNISEDLYDMLVVHEVGHAIDTPLDAWLAGIDKISANIIQNNAGKFNYDPATKKASKALTNAIKDFINVIEDARIDKRQMRRYPGCKRNYVKGYAELMDRDFFGLKTKDVKTLALIDRINTHFKTSGVIIPFTPEERVFVTRTANAETFDEVLQIAEELFQYHIDQNEQDSKSKSDVDAEDDMESDEDENGEGQPSDKMSDQDGDKTKSYRKMSEEEAEKADENKFSGMDEYIPISETARAAENNASQIVKDENVNYISLSLPEKFDSSSFVDNYKTLISQYDKISTRRDYYQGYNVSSLQYSNPVILEALQEFRNKERAAQSFMVKEFETRKAASTYAKLMTAKTGILDMNKLSTYKFNEDLFRRNLIIPKGKNHGFVIFMDWSGSMQYNLKNTVKQLISIALFCKRMNIPFEVYSFRTIMYNDDKRVEINRAIVDSKKDGVVTVQPFKIRNFLSSRMNATEFNKGLQILWTNSHNSHPLDYLNSTPLNDCILLASDLVNNFRKNNKVEIVNVVYLTDGASDPIRVNSDSLNRAESSYQERIKKRVICLTDPVTRKVYYKTDNFQDYGTTTILLRILKERTGANLIGFYLHNGSLSSLNTIVDGNILSDPKSIKKWNDEKFLAVSSSGYDQYFILNINKMDVVNKPLNIDPDMSKNRMLKAFQTFSDQKMINRSMLREFIARVATDDEKVVV